MATLEEIYTNTLTDEAERAAFVKAAPDAQALAAFLQERGCDATPDEARAFLDAKLSRTGELAAEELTIVSGGNCGGNDTSYTCPACGCKEGKQVSRGSMMEGIVCRCPQCGCEWNEF